MIEPRLARRWRRMLSMCLIVVAMLAALPGCGLLMRPADDGFHASRWPPRPLKRLREMRRERELAEELEHDNFPRAEQVGITPADEKR